MEVFLILWRSWHSIYFLHHWKNISQCVTSWMHMYAILILRQGHWLHGGKCPAVQFLYSRSSCLKSSSGFGRSPKSYLQHLIQHCWPWNRRRCIAPSGSYYFAHCCAMDTYKQISGHYNHSTYSLWRESDSWGKPCCISTKRFCLLFLFRFWVLSCYYNCFLSQGALMTEFDTEVQAYQNLPVQLVIILCRHKVQGLARYRHSTVGMAVVPLICSSLVNYCCY